MKVLVAGVTGLVGSAVYEKYKRIGEEVIGISTKDVDLLDRENTLKFIKELRPQVIIDAAARVGGIGANDSSPVEFLTQNLQIQNNLIDAAFKAEVEKFVFLGSSCIYPKDAKQPIPETELLNGHLEPTNSAYAIAKIAGIELINSYRKEYDKKWISLMPANLYGPKDNFNIKTGHVLPSLIHKFYLAKKEEKNYVELWGDGTALREFLHVSDLAEAVIFCAKNYNEGTHLNIGSGEEVSIKKLAEIVARKFDFQGEIIWDNSKPNGTPRKILDSTRIHNLGWKPIISLEEGITSTVNWFKNNPNTRV